MEHAEVLDSTITNPSLTQSIWTITIFQFSTVHPLKFANVYNNPEHESKFTVICKHDFLSSYFFLKMQVTPTISKQLPYNYNNIYIIIYLIGQLITLDSETHMGLATIENLRYIPQL